MKKMGNREALRLVDAIVLIAATAFALAAIRAVSQAPMSWVMFTPYSTIVFDPPLVQRLKDASFLTSTLSALLMAWSVALLVCGLWRRERRFRDILSSPGLMACAVALGVLPWSIVILSTIRIEITLPKGASFQLPEGMWPGMAIDGVLGFLKRKVGVCVMIAWTALALGRSLWKPSGWVEWAGLAIGSGWIAVWLSTLAFG